jgi:hypothetical protein
MHRVIGARRWGRLLGAAVLGGALAAGAFAAMPAEAGVRSSSVVRVASGSGLGDLSESGAYSDSQSGTTGRTDGNSLGNSLNNTDGNSLGNSLSNTDGNSLNSSLGNSL